MKNAFLHWNRRSNYQTLFTRTFTTQPCQVLLTSLSKSHLYLYPCCYDGQKWTTINFWHCFQKGGHLYWFREFIKVLPLHNIPNRDQHSLALALCLPEHLWGHLKFFFQPPPNAWTLLLQFLLLQPFWLSCMSQLIRSVLCEHYVKSFLFNLTVSLTTGAHQHLLDAPK